jgi:quercetin dioxygenase-like cupin family protein
MDGEEIAALKKQLREDGYNIYVYSYPGGMCFPRHVHDHHTVHIILSGAMRITIGDSEHVLGAGQRIAIPADEVHTAEVLGETPAVILDATKSRHP